MKSYTEREGSVFVEYVDLGLSIEYRDASHAYHLHYDGERIKVPSVTGILGVIDKPGLLHWSEAAGAEGAAILARQGELDGVPPEEAIQRVRLFKLGMAAKRDEAAARGTVVHSVLEAFNRTGTVPNVADYPPEIRGYVQGLCRWLLEANPEAILVETIVGSRLHKYAGRLDLFATIGGVRTLVDMKTSPKAVTYPESHLQCAGLEMAMIDCGFEPEAAVLLAVGEDGSYEEVGAEASGSDFLAVLDTYRVMARLKAKKK